jgi:hypothetical protein
MIGPGKTGKKLPNKPIIMQIKPKIIKKVSIKNDVEVLIIANIMFLK